MTDRTAMTNEARVEPAGERDLVMTRVFDAPRELVFEAYTKPEHLEEWWGPEGFTTTMITCDVRPGGQWRFIMHGPDGTDYPNRISYLEVVPPERLVFNHDDDKDEPEQSFRVTVTLTDLEGRTEVNQRLAFPSREARDAAAEYGIEGGKSTMRRLAAFLEELKRSS